MLVCPAMGGMAVEMIELGNCHCAGVAVPRKFIQRNISRNCEQKSLGGGYG